MNEIDDIIVNADAEQSEKKNDFDKEAWIQQVQKEKQWAFDTIDTMAADAKEGGEALRDYLDIRAQFPSYTVANSLLIAFQAPQATQLADAETWKKRHVYPQKGEKGIILLKPGQDYSRRDGSTGIDYRPRKMFDISQTTAKQTPSPAVSYDERYLMKALVHDAPCRFAFSDDLPDGVAAKYHAEENTVHVRKGQAFPDLFRSIAQEIAKAHMEPLRENLHTGSAFPSYCVSYVLCKRCGISTEMFRFDRMPSEYASCDARAFREDLDVMRDVAHSMSGELSRVLHPTERDKGSKEEAVR